MNKPRISMVVAVTDKNAAIGNGGELLVRISDDLKRFKKLTTGHPIIMGRKTFQSIGKALPGRANFIVTRNPDFKSDEATVCHSLGEAIRLASEAELASIAAASDLSGSAPKEPEIFLIGGGEIYAQGLPLTDRLYLTLVKSDLEGDVRFPDYSDFKKVLHREDRIDEKTGIAYSWMDLERGA